jgi:3-(3-hydroxy-phenyl)propionate hydroxylase
MTAARDATVLVAGAGPVGLTCALVLADAGVRVRVFDPLDALPSDGRASTFHPPTLELFERFGVTAELIRQGVVCPHWQVRWHPSGERAVFDLSVLQDETKYPYRLQCEQWRLGQDIHRRLQGVPHAEVAFGAEVCGVTQDDRSVSIKLKRGGRTESIAGDYLIGADGGHSFVRKAIGQNLEGDTYPETILIVETRYWFEEHLEELSYSTYCWREGGNFSMLRLPDRWRVGIYPLPGMTVEEQLSDANIESVLQMISPRAQCYQVLARRPYRAHNRIVASYRAGRVFLAGDAAHLNSPTGGMGMNGGLHDAFNLCDKLVQVIVHGADASILDRYDRQRRPIALAEILAQADRNRARMREQDPQRRRELLRDLQATARDRDTLKAYAMRTSMIEGYRRSLRIA